MTRGAQRNHEPPTKDKLNSNTLCGLAGSDVAVLNSKLNQRKGRFGSDHLMVAVLVAQSGLLVADRFYLLGLTRGDLWNVQLAAGLAGGIVSVGLLWGLVRLLLGRPSQFGLRCLLLLTLAAAIPSGWYAAWIKNAARQNQAVGNIRKIQARICSGTPHQQIRYGCSALTTRPGPRQEIVGIGFAVEVDSGCGCCYVNTGSDVSDEDLDQLSCLYRLERLDVPDAQITDAGLARLGNLKNLRELDLSGNAITDEGLAHLRGLKDLARLNVSRTGITDAGFVHLAALRSLQQLDFGSTSATGIGMKQLASLKSFKQCGDAKSNRALFSVSGAGTCNGLRHLEELYGRLVQPGEPQDILELDGHPKLRLVDLENGLALRRIRLSSLPALETARISVGPCSHCAPYGVPKPRQPQPRTCNQCSPGVQTLQLENLPQLESLSIAGVHRLDLHGTPNVTRITIYRVADRNHFRELGRLPKLQSLSVGVEAFSSPDQILALGFTPHLQDLLISGGGLNDASLAVLENVPALKRLSLPSGEFSAAGLACLRHLKSLEHLSVTGLRYSGEPLADLAGLPSLKSLQLQNADIGKLSLVDMPNLARLSLHGSRVGTLELADLPTLDSVGNDAGTAIRRLAIKRLPNLKTLSVRAGSAQTRLEHVELEQLPSLTQLSLPGHGALLTDDCLAQVATFTNLAYADLSNSCITDRTLESLMQLPRLVRVDVRNTLTSEAAVDRLRRGGPAKVAVSR